MINEEKYSVRSVYAAIKEEILNKALACERNPDEISLVAVSKGYSEESIQELYQLGQRQFAENRLVEGAQKIAVLPSDCVWHFIGHLQSNKLAKIISQFTLIHSVDNFAIAQKISQIAGKLDCSVSILLQVNTSGENTKQGLSAEEWETVLDDLNLLPNLCVEGLMTMAPFTREEPVIRKCFKKLAQLRDQWKGRMSNSEIFHHLSMGMSNDYLIAIEEGATLLRIGSALFKN